MEPCIANIDLRILYSPVFLELPLDARDRYAKLIGLCDRMGVSDLYLLWNSERVQPSVMAQLYNSKLVWEVNAFVCFLPDIFYANRELLKKAKYPLKFDVKGFQACLEKYPVLLTSLGENEKKNLLKSGVHLDAIATSTVGSITADTEILQLDSPEADNSKDELNEYSDEVRVIIDHLNQKTGSSFRPGSKTTVLCISNRIKEGFTIADFMKVIDKKTDEWLHTKYRSSLKPSTLFGDKFEEYLNAPEYRDHIKIDLPEYYIRQKTGQLPESHPASPETIAKLKAMQEKMSQ